MSTRFCYTTQAVCLLVIAACAFFLFAMPCEGKPLFPLPPQLDKVTTYGCSAAHVKNTVENQFFWHVRVQVSYLAGDKWTHLFAVREGTDRKNAMKDCGEWMGVMEKALKKVKKTQYEEAKPPPEPEEEDRTPNPKEVRKA